MESVAAKPTTQRYPAYRDSGEFWLNEIPEHWELMKLKHVFVEKKKQLNPNLPCGAISFGTVVFKDDEKVTEATKASYQEVKKGNFLINPLNLNYDLKSLRIALSDIDVVVSSGYLVLQDRIDLDRRYFKWLMHRYDVAYMKIFGSGVRQTISFNHIADSLVLYPPLPEQTAIANFLDDKCSTIDRAIAQKERMIELLKERKQIIIQQAVTRGLDPTVKMKDSGVEWIGEIPEHWEVKKVKHCAKKISKGTTPSTEGRAILDEGPVRFVKAENIVDGDITKFPAHYIDEKTNSLIGRSVLQTGDVLFVIAGATLGKIAIVPVTILPANTNQAVSFIRPNREALPQFMGAWLSTEIIREMTWLDATQSAQPNLSMENLGNFPILVPPVDEQIDLVSEIDLINRKFSSAITPHQTQIEKLKEYKSTLIDSAVTGKIKVC